MVMKMRIRTYTVEPYFVIAIPVSIGWAESNDSALVLI